MNADLPPNKQNTMKNRFKNLFLAGSLVTFGIGASTGNNLTNVGIAECSKLEYTISRIYSTIREKLPIEKGTILHIPGEKYFFEIELGSYDEGCRFIIYKDRQSKIVFNDRYCTGDTHDFEYSHVEELLEPGNLQRILEDVSQDLPALVKRIY